MAQDQSQVILGIPLGVFTSITALLSAVVGGIITNWLIGRREEKKRRLDFKERQLREFYGRLWGTRLEIRSLSVFRGVIAGTTLNRAQELTKDFTLETWEESKGSRDIVDEEHQRDIEFSNKQLHDELLPAYRKMQDVFRENIHLGDPESWAYFPLLVAFNNGWKRNNEGGWSNLPLSGSGVAVKEDELFPFYEHLDAKVRELTAEIAGMNIAKAPALSAAKLVEGLVKGRTEEEA